MVTKFSYEGFKKVADRQAKEDMHHLYEGGYENGRRLYKPVIPERSRSLSPAIMRGPRKTIHDDLLEEAKRKKIERRVIQEEHMRMEMHMQKELRAQALPQSSQLLREATERNIEEMFRLLLTSTQLLDTDDIDNETTRARIISKQSGASHLLPSTDLQTHTSIHMYFSHSFTTFV
jgi:hypothetical protein